MKKGLFRHCIWLISLMGCQETIIKTSIADDRDYLPLSIGNEWTYEVTSISYEISGFDTTNYWLKELVIDSRAASDETIDYTIERSKRSNESDPWEVIENIRFRQSKDQLLIQENNKTVTALSFPVIAGKSWDYNSHSSSSAQEISYSETAPDESDEGFAPLIGENPLAYVIITDIPANIVQQNQQYDVYVKSVGMVEKKAIVLDFCTVNCDSAGQINTGFYYKKTLIDYVVQ